MPKRSRDQEDSPGARRSGRASAQPSRFRPGADVPEELAQLIHTVACQSAAKSKVPFESNAIVALEEALEPLLEALCAAALKHAESKGRADIEVEDLKAVSSHYAVPTL